MPEAPDANGQSARLAELVRVLAKVAAGDYSEKPGIVEAEDEVSRFALAVRFMIDDLEAARGEQQRREEDLRRANAQLKELSEMKTRFINTAAHELNTPLTPIRIQLHMLRNGTLGPLNSRQQQAVDIVGRNLERLSLLVGDFLDAARLQAEHMKLVRKPTDLARLLHDTAETLRPQAEAAGIEITTDAREPVPMELDAQRVTQVMFNLLSNALKFTPAGGRIAVRAVLAPTEVLVSVKDSGAGLTADQRDRLFAPFSQVHDPMQHTVGGTGLGLFISRGIVEQHGGRIWVESDGPGRGATFAFALPLASPTPPTPPTPPGAVHIPRVESIEPLPKKPL